MVHAGSGANMARMLFAFLAAVATTTVLGSFAHTQFVLAELLAMNVPVPFDVRLATSVSDLAGLAPIYGGIIAAGFLIALPAAGLVALLSPGLRWFVFFVAGATAMVVILLSLQGAFGSVGVFGARGVYGHIAQAIAGGLGGLVFSLLKPAGEAA
jgi:hypothetical protein